MNNLRPTKFQDIVGQEKVLSRLDTVVKSAIIREDALPHVLFNAQPGLGKTTMAMALANERGVDIEIANGGNIRVVKQILGYLMRLTENSILFIDEIHRISPIVTEYLYPAMEDFRVDVGGYGKEMSLDIPRFTLIGATTEGGALAAPLYDRFTVKCRLQSYTNDELGEIILSNASKMNVSLDKQMSLSIAQRSRGVPRIANNLLLWIRDICVAGKKSPSISLINDAMEDIGVDPSGITEQDTKYLSSLKKEGRPVGLNTLSSLTGIDVDTIANVIEPFLIKKDLVSKTPRGRVAI